MISDFDKKHLEEMFATDCTIEQMATFMDVPLKEMYAILKDELGIGYCYNKKNRPKTDEWVNSFYYRKEEE